MNGVNIFMHEYYFKMGEFATICGVKKSTLVHYADIGLFKPHHIGENGYYYYSPTQIYVYECPYRSRKSKHIWKTRM